MENKNRKAIQIQTSAWGDLMYLTVLCDDGTIWEYKPGYEIPWSPMPPIPQQDPNFFVLRVSGEPLIGTR